MHRLCGSPIVSGHPIPGTAAGPAAEQAASSDAETAAGSGERTFRPLTTEHLDRLAGLVDRDHEAFTRPAGRPEYRNRRVLTVLAQGAAQHYLDCLAGCDPGSRKGVKDLDVWTFYAEIPGSAFPAAQRETHADFGHSSLGCQVYDLSAARTARERALWRRWATYEGRRVDFLMRALPVLPDAPYADVTAAVQKWLRDGQAVTRQEKPSSWHLARQAMVTVTPESGRGEVLWPVIASS
jgi:hypothetical protein